MAGARRLLAEDIYGIPVSHFLNPLVKNSYLSLWFSNIYARLFDSVGRSLSAGMFDISKSSSSQSSIPEMSSRLKVCCGRMSALVLFAGISCHYDTML